MSKASPKKLYHEPDILYLAYHKKVTDEEIDYLIETLVDLAHGWRLKKRPYESLRFTQKEYNAHIRGASLESIARWCYEGWPKQCHLCGKSLESNGYGWLVASYEKGADYLVHIDCVPVFEEEDEGFEDEDKGYEIIQRTPDDLTQEEIAELDIKEREARRILERLKHLEDECRRNDMGSQ